MALSATTIATGIAALVIAGVTTLDLDEIPMDASRAGLPVLFPDPENWGGEMTAEVQTLTVATAYWTATRNLGYLYLHAPAGSDRAPHQHFVGMSDKRDLIFEAVAEMDLAGVDVIGLTSSPIQVIADPAGNSFYGFRLGFIVRERMNA